VDWTHAIGVGQRQHISTSVIAERGYGTGRTGYGSVVRVWVAALLVALVAAAAAPAADVQLKIIFHEGQTARQMSDQVSAVRLIAIHKRHVTPVLTGARYATATATTPRPAGFPRGRSIEGFLFPAGYIFGPSTTADGLIELQLAQFAKDWATVDLGTRKPYDVLIVASMVERETAAPEERKLVSAVIWNRLAKGMPLAIDATLRYGLGIPGNRPITAAEQKNQTPYNTGIRPGLPPTPIGNPGLAAIEAAAHPANVNYLYFVRKPDHKHHYFTASYQDFLTHEAQYGY
jgi:uncharacterized YceG family protein